MSVNNRSPVNKDADKIKKQFKELEDKLSELNKKKTALELELAAPDIYTDNAKFVATENAYKKVNFDLKGVNKEYEEVFEIGRAHV